eukprot:15365607-Ditylum_brightwellii.AAC.1
MAHNKSTFYSTMHLPQKKQDNKNYKISERSSREKKRQQQTRHTQGQKKKIKKDNKDQQDITKYITTSQSTTSKIQKKGTVAKGQGRTKGSNKTQGSSSQKEYYLSQGRLPDKISIQGSLLDFFKIKNS